MENIITLKEKAIEAIERAEENINKLNASLVNIENYHFNMGRFYAFLDILEMIDDDAWSEVWDNFSETVGKLDELCDVAERKFKK